MQNQPVQVLTAGGAGALRSKQKVTKQKQKQNNKSNNINKKQLEYEDTEAADAEEVFLQQQQQHQQPVAADALHLEVRQPLPLAQSTTSSSTTASSSHELFWLLVCFLGIMASFVCYGLLLEYTTSGGRKLHELSFLFVTSGLYTLTAAAGRYVRDETPSTIPPAKFAILGVTSMASTFCSVRSLRYVCACVAWHTTRLRFVDLLFVLTTNARTNLALDN
jgi:hypothetical protein